MNTNIFEQKKLKELGDQAKSIIQEFLDLHKIPYKYMEYEGHQFGIQIQAKNNKIVSLVISVEPDKLSYGFNAIMSYCSNSMAPTIMLLLNQINSKLRYGSFCCESEENAIIYHYCVPYIDPIFSIDDFEASFEVVFSAIKAYVDKINDITEADFTQEEKEFISKEIKQLFKTLQNKRYE